MGKSIDMSDGEADYLKYRFKQYLGSVSRAIQNRRLKEQVEMTREEAIHIAEEFCEWLEDMAEKYGWDKNDIQSLIKQLLM